MNAIEFNVPPEDNARIVQNIRIRIPPFLNVKRRKIMTYHNSVIEKMRPPGFTQWVLF